MKDESKKELERLLPGDAAEQLINSVDETNRQIKDDNLIVREEVVPEPEQPAEVETPVTVETETPAKPAFDEDAFMAKRWAV